MTKLAPGLLGVGTPAPDFSLEDVPEHWLELDDFKGAPLLLLFYVADFHPVCTRQLTIFNEALPEFHRQGAQIVGLSADAIWSHLAFARDYNLHFPLLSDAQPKGAVAKLYRCYDQLRGTATRTAYLVSPTGKIVWATRSNGQVAMGAGDALAALRQIVGNAQHITL